jgi:hypothetical protein
MARKQGPWRALAREGPMTPPGDGLRDPAEADVGVVL